VPVIVMTAYGSIDEAVQAMKDGAHDFLQKPVDSNHLLLLVERALEQLRLRTENLLLREEWSKRYGFPRIIGESEAIKRTVGETQRVAQTDATVLLLGESGTGKELFARAVHHLSKRRDKPFVAINCAALPETLIENELFGHERGAFTGARERRLGKFELAAGGTVFLDEIGELPLAVQGKLLRAIEEKAVDRIGGKSPIPVDVRGRGRHEQRLARGGRWRCVSRRSVFSAGSFPDRDTAVARARRRCGFARPSFRRHKSAKNCGGREATLIESSIAAIKAHAWPGNVRELENSIERACILSDGLELGPLELGLAADAEAEASLLNLDLSGSLAEATDRMVKLVERQKIAEALAACDGNKTRAAEGLGVSYKTLLTKIKEYNL
jgi:DNA-binding NtrC family response regulator